MSDNATATATVPETSRPARNRTLARRNAAIYNAVKVNRESQTSVAARYGMTQARVSQIVNNPFSHEY